ncbi:hypothetical protein BDM02DRAFT_3131013 [Thelephora ganbajun]|uniref:Uncharacterized protein n=1 Tax=Thelephora ganbajun TaxID=370292 RepID=A0ACB6Z7Q3_THEGA|nr:hypothetical protein BDM02DRAFT_3131013 [Thelephora ganbajun]
MARTTTTAASSKDPSKLSKADLLRLYMATVTKNDTLTKKYSQLHKKYKRAKMTLEASKGSAAPRSEDLIPYPTGQTPGRGDFNLFSFLDIGQEEYNAFVASIHQALIAAGISKTALWRNVPAGPLAEVLDIVREQYPWLATYCNDWPATGIIKQYLRNCRSSIRRKARRAHMNAAAAIAAATAGDHT